jgi:hypothetical protein
MRRLELDFHRSPRPSPWGWALLLGSLISVVVLLLAHRQISDEASRHRATITRVEARLPGASLSTAAPAADATLTAARRVTDQQQQPWAELFAALEAADNKDVAVLTLDPEPARGVLKIQAEARNLGAMLAYHRRLEAGGALRQVVLQAHDFEKEATEAPVRFHLVANWGGRRGGP